VSVPKSYAEGTVLYVLVPLGRSHSPIEPAMLNKVVVDPPPGPPSMISASFSRNPVGSTVWPSIWNTGIGAGAVGGTVPVELNSTWSYDPEIRVPFDSVIV
jgi:hypothetical protein